MVVAAPTPYQTLLSALAHRDFFSRAQIHTNNTATHSLVAATSFNTHDVILRLPPPHLLTSHVARSIPAINYLISRAPATMTDAKSDAAALQLYIIYTLRTHRMKEWSDLLPPLIELPTTSDAAVVEENLSDTPLILSVQSFREQLDHLFDHWIHPCSNEHTAEIGQLRDISKNEFFRAHSIVESRAFKLEQHTVIAPLADMMNHSYSNNAIVRAWRVSEHDGLSNAGIEVCALQPIAEGQEITIRYGELANWQLLLHWGFCLSINSNPYESVNISLEPPHDTRHVIILSLNDIEELHFSMSLSDPLPSDLVAACRILMADEDELCDAAKRNWFQKVSDRNENVMIESLTTLITGLRPPQTPVDGVIPTKPNLSYWCQLYQRGIHSIIDYALGKLQLLHQ